MGKLIDADALIESLKYSHTACIKWAKDAKDEFVKLRAEQAQVTFAECILRVKGMPEAVVRCKDCVYGQQDEIGRWSCESVGTVFGADDGSGFCCDGERRKKDNG